MIDVFIGYDTREAIAYHVLSHSIASRASAPVRITPLVLDQLTASAHYTRPVDDRASTQFSLTRFLVPHLMGFEGIGIFMDCDMLCLVDVLDLIRAVSLTPGKAVHVVKHNYMPKPGAKFMGAAQHAYPRKNWSSLMVFQAEHCRALTKRYVNEATPAELHRFAWLKDEEIGELSYDWNWLVGEYDDNPSAKILHYTLGGPWFPELVACDRADDWHAERRHMMTVGR